MKEHLSAALNEVMRRDNYRLLASLWEIVHWCDSALAGHRNVTTQVCVFGATQAEMESYVHVKAPALDDIHAEYGIG